MTDKTLPSFKLFRHICKKCRQDDVYFYYHAGTPWVHETSCAAIGQGEHICLKCSRCGYRWAMQTADAGDNND